MSEKKTCGHNCHLLRSGVECSPCKFKETQNDTKMKNILFTRTNNIYELGEITVLNFAFDSEKQFLDYLAENCKKPFIAFYNFNESIFNLNDEIEIINTINKISSENHEKCIVIHLPKKKCKIGGYLGTHIERICTAIIQ